MANTNIKAAAIKAAAKTATKVEEVKVATTEKAAEAKKVATEKAATAKKATAKKATTAKKAATATAKKATTAAKKATTAKKEAAPKKAAAKKAETAVVNFQFAGKSYTTEDLVKITKDVWKYDLGKKATDLKTVELYVKPEESLAYYVINGEITGSFAI